MTTQDTSAHQTIDLDAPRPPTTTAGPTSTDRLRDAILAGATVLGPLLMMVAMLLEVDEGGENASGATFLGKISEEGVDRFWTSTFLGALGLVLLAATGLTVMRLIRERGGALATAGGLLLVVSSIAAGAGIFMYGGTAAAMTDPSLDREAMGALQDHFEDAWQVMPPFLGFIGTLIAFVLIAAALLRSRVTPLWVPAAIVVAAIAFTFVSEGGVVSALSLLPLLAVCTVLAGRLLQRTDTR